MTLKELLTNVVALFKKRMETTTPNPFPSEVTNTATFNVPVSPVTSTLPAQPIVLPFIDPKLVQAIIEVESDGNDNAIGDLHLTDHAYGCMQIRQGVVDICNIHLGTHYKSQDCLGNRNLSITLFTEYFHIFTGLTTDEDRAKAWNGGAGWKQYYGKPNYEKYTENLNDYWTKVQKYL